MKKNVDQGFNKTFSGRGAPWYVDDRQSAAAFEVTAQISIKPSGADGVSFCSRNSTPGGAAPESDDCFCLRRQQVHPIRYRDRPPLGGPPHARKASLSGTHFIRNRAFQHQYEWRQDSFSRAFEIGAKRIAAFHRQFRMNENDARHIGYVALNQIFNAWFGCSK